MSIAIDVGCVSCWSGRLRRVQRLTSTAFTAEEINWARGEPARLTLAWTVKESVLKLLGCGFDGIGWKGVALIGCETTQLHIRLSPPAQELCHQRLVHPLVAVTCLGPSLVATALTGDCAATRLAAVCYQSYPRQARARAASRAARQAGRRAAHELGVGPVRFTAPREASPSSLGLADRPSVEAAFSHDCGIAIAAVSAARHPARGDATSFQLSDKLTIKRIDARFPR
ncbi:4-phosphopantetheinyl transferase family protein [Flexivirga sp. ID2601S]|uniref:4-phosphopantetheinyl transferase family protein n=1 Tax=Flexivirga aerilata TaxID=1656889 RepID=A0A849ADC3_9MICO|nr:4'-phosphopantetheinyl transferase superfamily protein [Flexivirga aerilata]NNG38505.1 4-phosphopantetheinyl transferase family protein [Flexivirga aerilata]